MTFSESLHVHVDDIDVHLVFQGPAHTTNDVVAWLPSRRVLFAGDLVFQRRHAVVVMGSVAGSIEAVTRIRALEPSIVVPGHGDVCGVEVIDDELEHLRFVQSAAGDAVAAGQTPLEAAASLDLAHFAAWHDTERIVGNLHRAMAEERGLPPGDDLDILGAIGDMVPMQLPVARSEPTGVLPVPEGSTRIPTVVGLRRACHEVVRQR